MMQDFIIADLIYISPLVFALIAGTLLWLVVRLIYRKPLFNGDFWHPALIDMGFLFLCIYLVYPL